MSEKTLNHLAPHARDLALRSLEWMDGCWDDAAAMFREPVDVMYEAGRLGVPAHLIRETSYYALGLLLRDGPGDRARAARAIEALLAYQHDEPGQPYHGTWYRTPAEPHPPENPRMWRDYDPNWREFIGCALIVALIEYEGRLPAELVGRIEAALVRAIDGTIARDVPASYTNIALMTAFLLEYGSRRFGRPEWAERAERLAAAILERFRANGTFDEYNSPTYYGVDLYALALWRVYSGSAALRAAGTEMEAALWRDIGQFYHAEMRNICGPFDRSYGMDLRAYVSCLGMWIWLATGFERAPFPDLGQPLVHSWDFAFGVPVALVGLEMPADAQPHFTAFAGERAIERVVASEPRRVATAWVGERAMLGGADYSSSFRINDKQFHPATLYWLADDGQVGWLRIRNVLPVDARAGRGRLEIVCSKHEGGDLEFTFEIAAPPGPRSFGQSRWELPGLAIAVETTAAGPEVREEGDTIGLTYRARDTRAGQEVRFTLRIDP